MAIPSDDWRAHASSRAIWIAIFSSRTATRAARPILLEAAREDAATGLLDLKRLGDLLSRIKGRIIHKDLERISPLSVPIMLEIGREPVYGEAQDEILAEAADILVEEAFGVGVAAAG